MVAKPFGVRGQVYVRPDPDLDYQFPPGAQLQTEEGLTLSVAASQVHSGRRIVAFDGVTDREAAEGLRGVVLSTVTEQGPLEPDTYWVDELIGEEVRDQHGELVGVVEGVQDGLAHDYLVVARTDGGELLLPAVADLVTVTAAGVTVQAIPGLLD